jgi:hypothetical protein
LALSIHMLTWISGIFSSDMRSSCISTKVARTTTDQGSCRPIRLLLHTRAQYLMAR